ncbi:MAG TPA: HAD-IA family hydrolase [Solimonas sp.]|nr:HAD-IA family hydrolase [Solimonas sp.]
MTSTDLTYRLIVFDWDGTLADSAGMIVGAMQGAIRGLDLPARDDKVIRELIGLGLNEALAALYPELELEALKRLLEGYRREWLGGSPGEAPLFAGALDALRDLHGAGHRLAIATGKGRRGLDRSLRHHAELHALVSSSRCADETQSKPHPQMLEEILELEGVAAHDALMVGDTEYDMAMARAIGMPALGVTCGVHEAQRMRGAGAIALIENVACLPAWLRDKTLIKQSNIKE